MRRNAAINGIEALQRLRADPVTSSTPVIAVTASVMTQDRSRIMAAGFDGFQSKPISVTQCWPRCRTPSTSHETRRCQEKPIGRLILIDGLNDPVTARGYVRGQRTCQKSEGVRTLNLSKFWRCVRCLTYLSLINLVKRQNEREGEIERLHTPPEK